MDDKRANELLHKWQKTLGLDDWKIKLVIDVAPEDMTLSDVEGEAVWTESTKNAIIRILKQDFYGDRIVPFRFEKTLIHELLHLKFCLLGESGNQLQDRYAHQLIDDLARALYEVDSREYDWRDKGGEK